MKCGNREKNFLCYEINNQISFPQGVSGYFWNITFQLAWFTVTPLFHCLFLFSAWIGSLSIALMFFTGPVSGLLVSKAGCRLTTLIGALICAISLATASLCEGLETMYLSYSIPFGIGTSFVFNAGLVIVSSYFNKRRSLALGFVSAGQGLGVLAQGPLLQKLINSYGWKTTYRIMAGVVFGVCLLGISYDPNVKSEGVKDKREQLSSATDDSQPRQRRLGRRGIFLDVSVWKVPVFVVLTLSSSIAQFGHFIPQIHLVCLIHFIITM